MMIDKEVLSRWEQAEIERGDYEASHSQGADLRISPGQLRRYMAPPADTPYAIEYAYNQLGDVRGRRVLDLGCGSGENTLLLVNRGAEVHGVDISKRLLSLARRRMWVNGIAGGFKF